MDVKKAIKKVVALGAGAFMVGATMMGALAAADLANYPAPFITDDMKFDALMVVGDKAAAEDVIGITDIAMSLQYAMKKSTVVSTGTTSSAVVASGGESHKVEQTSNKLNVGDAITNVSVVAIDGDDLPTALADGTYTNTQSNDYGYEQKIVFYPGRALDMFADSDYDDKEPTMGFRVARNSALLNYTLDFTKSAISINATASATDVTYFKNTKIEMLGKTYDIVDADASGNGKANVDKLQLMGGALSTIMEEGEEKTFTVNEKEYKVKVSYLGGTTPEAKFIVDGEVTDAITEGNTDKLTDGTEIGVKEILIQNLAGEVDKVEFYIGAEKVTIEHKDKIELGGEDVDSITCDINATVSGSSNTEMAYIRLTWTPDEDLFITEESSAEFPGLGGFKLSYEGLTRPGSEIITVENSGNEELQLTVPIKSGEATIKLLGSNGTSGFDTLGGDDHTDERLLTSLDGGRVTWNESYEALPVTYYDGSNTGETYLVEVTKIDDTDGATFKDLVTGTKWENKKAGSFTIGSATLTLANLNETLAEMNITPGTNTYFDRVITEEGMMIYLPVENTTMPQSTANRSHINTTGTDPATWVLYMAEENKDGSLGSGQWINVTLGHASNKVQVNSFATLFSGTSATLTSYEIGTTKEYISYVKSDLATKINYDTDPDQDTLVIDYAGDEVYGNFYISDTAVAFEQTESAGEGAVTSEELIKINVGAVKLASDLEGKEKESNVILVGGPCANPVAAVWLGNPEDCAAGFEAGKAKIKLMEDETSGKVALLVAGYGAKDTQRASKVVAEYDSHTDNFKGAELEVVTTSDADIAISAPAAEEAAAE